MQDEGSRSSLPAKLIPVRELYELQPSIGRPFTFAAILSTPTGRHVQMLEDNDAAWARGSEVWPQVSPRPLKFSISMLEPFTLNTIRSFASLMGQSPEARGAAYADPAFRSRCRDEWSKSETMVPRWDTFVVSECATKRDVEGARLEDLAAAAGGDPFDVLLDLAAREPSMRVDCVLANDDPAAVAQILSREHCTLGLSDAGAHVGQLCDAPQATDFLGTWVRDRGLMPLEEGLRRLTSQQADIFGLADRGRIAAGFAADLVVFDPATIAAGPVRRVSDFPGGAERLTADQPKGIRHVLVNGQLIQHEGVPETTARPGQLLRPGIGTTALRSRRPQ